MISYNPFTSSWRLISGTMHIRRLFLAICAISFFWTMGAVLIIIFNPLAKNVLTAEQHFLTLVIALFPVGVAVGASRPDLKVLIAGDARFWQELFTSMTGVETMVVDVPAGAVGPDGDGYDIAVDSGGSVPAAPQAGLLALAATRERAAPPGSRR